MIMTWKNESRGKSGNSFSSFHKKSWSKRKAASNFARFFVSYIAIREEELDLSLERRRKELTRCENVWQSIEDQALRRGSFFSNLYCKNVVLQFHET